MSADEHPSSVFNKRSGSVPPTSGLELRTLITSGGELRLWLEDCELPELAADEVLIQVQATPVNPSDIGLLFGPADLSTLRNTGTIARPEIVASVPAPRLAGAKGRLDQPLPAGNEGAGVVVAAGTHAQSALGRGVATQTYGMYAQYRVARLADCLVLATGTFPRDAASAFINPLTALGMIETARLEGHRALVHTAAASNLGQILTRLCVADGVPLVNVVRSDEQAEVLHALGARHVVNSTRSTFLTDLDDAIARTGATLAFDAIGGGQMAGTILSSMERALSSRIDSYSRYGSPTHKQVYVYGGLDDAPTQIHRSFGMAWSVSGWLMTSFMHKIERQSAQRLRARVAAELTSTFASHFTGELSLAEALSADEIKSYTRRATGEKYLINPSLGLD